jgi:hypothetical protein
MVAMMWNYIVAHWSGRLGLLRSCLLNGAAVYCLLLLVSWAIATSAAVGSSPMFVYAVAGVFVLWGIWAGVGIFRCGGRNAFDSTNTTIRRIGGVAAIAGVVLVAWFMAKDVYYLFVRPLF